MNLSEIEELAETLTQRLTAETTGRQEALLLGIQVEGLKDLAQIKSTVAFRKEREDELTRMKDALRQQPLITYPSVPAVKIPPAVAGVPGFVRCPATKFQDGWTYRCRSVAGHDPAGAHDWVGSPNPPDEEPTKPAVDRLHELVSYLHEQSRENHGRADRMPDGYKAAKYLEAAGAYDDAALKLREILREGEL